MLEDPQAVEGRLLHRLVVMVRQCLNLHHSVTMVTTSRDEDIPETRTSSAVGKRLTFSSLSPTQKTKVCDTEGLKEESGFSVVSEPDLFCTDTLSRFITFALLTWFYVCCSVFT